MINAHASLAMHLVTARAIGCYVVEHHGILKPPHTLEPASICSRTIRQPCRRLSTKAESLSSRPLSPLPANPASRQPSLRPCEHSRGKSHLKAQHISDCVNAHTFPKESLPHLLVLLQDTMMIPWSDGASERACVGVKESDTLPHQSAHAAAGRAGQRLRHQLCV